MLNKIPLFVWLCSCAAMSNPVSPPVEPMNAAATIRQELSEATERAGTNRAEADQAWARAYDVFESQIEPQIRQRCGRRTTTEIEYAFGTVRAVLDNNAEAAEAVETIHDSMSACLNSSEG